MARTRTEEEVDSIISNLIENSKSKYITQGVAFNKESKSQMLLLKMALMSSYSFGALMKELIAEKFIEGRQQQRSTPVAFEEVLNNDKEFEIVKNNFKDFERTEKTESRGVGNFI